MSTISQVHETPKPFEIVAVSTPADIEIGVRFRYAMKLELDMDVGGLLPDWAERETGYFVGRTANGGAQWHLARINSEFVGSSCAYVDDGWHSKLVRRSANGWIIGVYVRPEFRGRGVARALSSASLEWLRGTGCKKAKLHASPFGRGIYESLGFTNSNEMELTL
jgi:GNAT superfamily N-acetyltransferase